MSSCRFPRPACAGCARRRSCATSSARRAWTPSDLVLPLFVQSGRSAAHPIAALPGVERLSISAAVEEAGGARRSACPPCCCSASPSDKDAEGTGAYDDEGIVQLATRAIKEAHPELLVMTDVCLCEYTDHGHCGLIARRRRASTTTRASS